MGADRKCRQAIATEERRVAGETVWVLEVERALRRIEQ